MFPPAFRPFLAADSEGAQMCLLKYIKNSMLNVADRYMEWINR